MKFSDLVQQLGIDNHHSLIVKPGCDPDLTGVEQIEQARSGSLSYIEGAKFAAYLTTTPASALVLPLDAELQSIATDRGIAWVAAAQPRKLLASHPKFIPRPSSIPRYSWGREWRSGRMW
jgi:UDP-3-O-[3-hydroxymyristoyl] glucosamine N-acyltransferase